MDHESLTSSSIITKLDLLVSRRRTKEIRKVHVG